MRTWEDGHGLWGTSHGIGRRKEGAQSRGGSRVIEPSHGHAAVVEPRAAGVAALATGRFARPFARSADDGRRASAVRLDPRRPPRPKRQVAAACRRAGAQSMEDRRRIPRERCRHLPRAPCSCGDAASPCSSGSCAGKKAPVPFSTPGGAWGTGPWCRAPGGLQAPGPESGRSRSPGRGPRTGRTRRRRRRR
jgi:hypothetical protein